MKQVINLLACILFAVCAKSQLYVSAGSPLYIADSGVITVSSGDIMLKDSIGGSGSGRLLINGSATQNIYNNGFSVYGLEVNNANNVLLNSNIYIPASLTLTAGSLVMNDNVLKLGGAVSGGGTLTGSRKSALVINGSAATGTLNFSTGKQGNILSSFTMNGTAVTLADTVNVADSLVLAAGVLNTGGYLVLNSDSTTTAIVKPVTGGSINGNITVERYIPKHRAWRLLTAPLSNTGTIYKNWQNNGLANGATGVNIWKPGGTGPTGDGFTAGGGQASIESYNSTVNGWIGLDNTTSTLLSGTGASAANTGWGLFVTGPYGSNNIVPSTGAAATTLRAAGSLQTGTQTFVANTARPGDYVLVGNPYASPIDFTQIGANGKYISNTMWAWDAQRGNTSYGGYVTFMWDASANGGAGGYDQDFDSDSTAQTSVIQSGEAFFVQAVGRGTPTITINETDKAGAPTITGSVFGIPQQPTAAQQLRISLNRTQGQVDGVLAKFGDVYKADVSDDAAKLFNYDENLSFKLDTDYLAIERRPEPTAGDTMHLDVYALKKNTAYSFTLRANITTDLKAWLADNYTNTKTHINLSGATTASFNTGADAGSLSETRFAIVFQTSDALASATTLQATQTGVGVQVGWVTPYELGVKQYQLQRAADAQNFTTIHTATPRNSGIEENYSFNDLQPTAGNNYYRVKILANSSATTYSNIALVKVANGTQKFAVYPNPVAVNRQAQILLTDMAAGKYALTLYSTNGKQLTVQTINHNGGTAQYKLALPQGIAKGSYRLVLVDSNGGEWKQQLVVE